MDGVQSFSLDEIKFYTSTIYTELDIVLNTEGIEALYKSALQRDLINHPFGLELEIELDYKDYKVLLTSALWGKLTIYCGAGHMKEYLLDPELSKSHTILRRIVMLANSGISNLTYASDIILAQFSSNEEILHSLASSGDSMVRAFVQKNPNAREESKVLVNLRDSTSNAN
jgi:hypothetical protein